MSVKAAQTVLAFDYGSRKVGVAVGNSLTQSAQPLAVLAYLQTDHLFDQIKALLTEWQPTLLVVGRPLEKDGSSGLSTIDSDRFARRLAGRFNLPVERVDERYSSVGAASELLEADHESIPQGRRRPRKTPENEDATAAAIILRQYWHGN